MSCVNHLPELMQGTMSFLNTPYHEQVHIVSLGLQVATVNHSIIVQSTAVIFHRCDISPFEQLKKLS